MKKNLLITIGDSFTQGVGTDVEHEMGWPLRVGKKIGYDKLINLGEGGSANSSHVKRFVERILTHDYSDWNVLVIWMMTDPNRFSFYTGYGTSPKNDIENKNFHPNIPQESLPLEDAFYKTIKEPWIATRFEQVFYLKVMEQICENNNFDFLVTGWDSEVATLTNIYESKYFLHPKSLSVWDEKIIGDRSTMTAPCGHPNEEGYELISEMILRWINEFHPHIKRFEHNENIQNIHNSKPLDFFLPNDKMF